MKSVLFGFASLFASGCLFGDASSGESTYNYTCAGCHGVVTTGIRDTGPA